MADQRPTNTPSSSRSDEIDLGQLFQIIGKGFNRLFRSLLRVFLYLKKNFFKLAILVVAGFAIGYALKFVISDKLKTEVIVKPNFDSRDYLYNVVEEIEVNLANKDTTFFKDLGIVVSELESLRIEIESIEEQGEDENLKNDLRYLEILQSFNDDDFIADVVKTEVLKKSGLNHRITFYYKNPLAGREATKRLIAYINDNEYFNELRKIYYLNAQSKIEHNQELINQIDALIDGFSQNLTSGSRVELGAVVLENESLEVPGLLSLKNTLLKEIERKRLEIAEQKEVVSIINFGKNQKVRVPVYNQGILVIPIILVVSFLLISFFGYLNKKASEL